MSEADLQASVIELARLYGYLVAHFRSVRTQHKDGTVRWQTPVAADGAGFVDLVLVRNDRCWFVELKSSRGVLSPDQIRWREALVSCRAVSYFLWDTNDWLSGKVDQLLR